MDPISPIAHLGAAIGAVLIVTLLFIWNTLEIQGLKRSLEVISQLKNTIDSLHTMETSMVVNMEQIIEILRETTRTDQTLHNQLLRGQGELATNQTNVVNGIEKVVGRLLEIVEAAKE